MGRNWYWSSGNKSTKTSSSTAATTTSKRARDSSASTPSGCISAVFHFFDFHHFQFPLHHHSPSSDTNTSLHEKTTSVVKEIEATRNSLEFERERSSASSPTDEKLSIPKIGNIQIKTRPRNDLEAQSSDFSSEISSSPATKTPTLVARLMGLDLLPDPPSASTTPKSLHLQHKRHLQIKHRSSLDGHIGVVRATRSLPETPRFSAARRSDGDLHLHHRLSSLLLNKDNSKPTEKLNLSRLNSKKETKINDGNRDFARQKVNRKVGNDITNTVRNREELVSQFKAKKISKALTLSKITEECIVENQNSTQSRSPRLKSLEPRFKIAGNIQKPEPLLPFRHSTVKPKFQPEKEEQRPGKIYRKGEKFSPRIKKPVQEEPYIRHSMTNFPEKRLKKIPLSNNHNISVPTLFPAKKDSVFPSSPASKASEKQITEAQKSKQSSPFSSSTSQQYKQRGQNRLSRENFSDDRCNCTAAATSSATNGGETETAEAEEQEYITRILRQTGIDEHTPVPFTRWFSPSNPLDPSVFYHLENFTDGENKILPRNLVFHLVGEILPEILKPIFNSGSGCFMGKIRQIRGSELIEMLCSRIRSYSGADCQVLEDIDSLIESDLSEKTLKVAAAYEEEGEGIVAEIERRILDELVSETAEEFINDVVQLGDTEHRSTW